MDKCIKDNEVIKSPGGIPVSRRPGLFLAFTPFIHNPSLLPLFKPHFHQDAFSAIQHLHRPLLLLILVENTIVNLDFPVISMEDPSRFSKWQLPASCLNLNQH